MNLKFENCIKCKSAMKKGFTLFANAEGGHSNGSLKWHSGELTEKQIQNTTYKYSIVYQCSKCRHLEFTS